MTSHQLANELANLANHLKQQPDLDVGRIYLHNSYGTTTEQFKSLAKVFPKPMKKSISHICQEADICLDNERNGTDSLRISFSIPQNKVCRLVTPAQPAVYDCEPLLSPEEEAELESL